MALFGKFKPKLAFFKHAFPVNLSVYWGPKALFKNGAEMPFLGVLQKHFDQLSCLVAIDKLAPKTLCELF